MSSSKYRQGSFIVDDNGNEVGVVLDGSVYRLQSIGKVLNSAGSQINPATQETLTSIKDTDGIKKIIDPLPAGTNNIGSVDVGMSVLPDGAATEAQLFDTRAETSAVLLELQRIRVLLPSQFVAEIVKEHSRKHKKLPSIGR